MDYWDAYWVTQVPLLNIQHLVKNITIYICFQPITYLSTGKDALSHHFWGKDLRVLVTLIHLYSSCFISVLKHRKPKLEGLISSSVLHRSPTAKLEIETLAQFLFMCSNHQTLLPRYYIKFLYSDLVLVHNAQPTWCLPSIEWKSRQNPLNSCKHTGH